MIDLCEKLNNTENKITICGIMSGTSLDGIDLSIVDFKVIDGKLSIFNTVNSFEPYSDETKIFFQNIINKRLTIEAVSDANFLVSKLYADAFFNLLKNNNINKNDIDFLSVHGQTLWHKPVKSTCCLQQISSTYQAVSIPALMALTGISTIGDFRSADIAIGGQGAPLVPIFDKEFCGDSKIDIITLNIGGMSNITYIPVNEDIRKILAFDTGPGNVLIDLTVKKYYGLDYDKNGRLAANGELNLDLLNSLMATDFILQPPPKSTGRELFNQRLIDKCLKDCSLINIAPNNLIRTLTEFTACSIVANIQQFANSKATVIVSGGGTKNVFLFKLIQSKLHEATVIKSDDIGIASDFKESIAFAYLGYKFIMRQKSSVSNGNCSENELILGALSLAD